ncbi:nuclear membrane fusion protein kar5 [Colletotrichum plurivorum]|uniref:Nuclear membrane fusion protein kar5 n=1 Tax=Colletotrichum plurivorum TaxID=2175906 RepID=A0A8H6N8X7_9PEZI|nr:nuclear membrane fusion protein kar5 [Colletotrichum plurivorum]
MRSKISQVLWCSFLVFQLTGRTRAFSWGGRERRPDASSGSGYDAVGPLLEVQSGSRLPKLYAVAMQELEQLQSEPLCHRIAARLLVNNCQLLDGKDDATVLTDSGRQVRDFVDSYAASLAICDLERGSFDIPAGCSPFRETSLAVLPNSNIPRLHVSPQQIDSCLSGLARSDPAWNTWVSYRHKALRFCEAARADNEKAQSILLHQRLTEVLSKLSEGIEQELEAHFSAINTRANEATDKLRRIIPDVDQLRQSLRDMDQTLSHDLAPLVEASHLAMRNGLNDAENLQQLLAVLLKTVLSNNAEVAASHETHLTTIKERAGNEIEVIASALSSVAVSSAALNSQMGLGKLFAVAENLSYKYETHAEKLTQAQQVSESILETLDEMVVSASKVHRSFLSSAWATWSPYIIYPMVTLFMGSYGLAPSVMRNIGLIILGEWFKRHLVRTSD